MMETIWEYALNGYWGALGVLLVGIIGVMRAMGGGVR